MTDPTSAPTPAQERQEDRDAQLVGDVVVPFVACLLDIRAAIDTFAARAGKYYSDTTDALHSGINFAIDNFASDMRYNGMLKDTAHDWWLILNDPAKTAAWYAGHKAANPRRYPPTEGAAASMHKLIDTLGGKK